MTPSEQIKLYMNQLEDINKAAITTADKLKCKLGLNQNEVDFMVVNNLTVMFEDVKYNAISIRLGNYGWVSVLNAV